MDGYDSASVRGLYPSLAQGWTYLNAHTQPQIPEMVAGRMASAFRQAPIVAPPAGTSGIHSRQPQPGETFGAGYDAAARRAVSDFLGGSAEAVVLGPSIPILAQALARSMRARMGRGSTLIYSTGDPEFLTQPFIDVASTVRSVAPDVGSGRSAAADYAALMDGSVRLAIASAADYYTGIVGEISALAEIVHGARAWLLIDASAYAPYRPVDIDHWDADIVLIDCGALGGPQVAAALFRTEEMIHGLGFEGAQDFEAKLGLGGSIDRGLLGGVTAIIDHYAGLSQEIRGLRRRRIAHSMGVVAEHFEELMSYLIDSLMVLDSVHILGISGETGDPYADHIARLSFIIQDVPASTVYQRLVANGILASITPSTPLTTIMGVEDTAGAVSISLSPFSHEEDVDNLVRVLTSLA